MTRAFTIEQANRTLPLVRRIVRDIVDHYATWQDTVGAFELATAATRAEAPSDDADGLQREAQRLAEEIQGFISELDALGVQFKGFDLGLVDFPSDRDGRQILLCWKLDESEIGFWHDVGVGYGSRQRLEPSTPLASTHQEH